MDIVRLPLADLSPDPDNPREHSVENIEAIKASLEAFGQQVPLVVHAETKMVIGGNGTMRAMLDLGITEAAVTLYGGSMLEARALSLALNRSAELAGWHPENLGKALVLLEESKFDYEPLGFDEAFVQEQFPTPEPIDTGGGGEDQGSPGLGNPVIQYALIFDDETQQQRFFSFVRWLKTRYPSYPTNAARLDAAVTALMQAADE